MALWDKRSHWLDCGDAAVIWYYLFMGLLTVVVVVWLIIAFREDGPGDSG